MMPDAKNKKLVAEQSFAGYEFSAYMGGKGMDKSLVNKARRILASVLIAALCVCNMAVPAFAEEAIAASFRLYQTEGTVTVQNQNGKEITAMQDMKLFNGYQVSTEQKSYAWFEADSTKLFKMDAVSNLEVRKKGKQSELLLNSGNLFFNVTEHLQDDEVLNIRTSSMVVGIRGTSGWVKVIDQYHTILYMLEGSVEASVTDPVSGQRKSITLRGGQRAEFWIYDKNKEGDKCDIIVRQYGEEEIDGFVAVELKKNQQLQDRIRGGGGSGAGGSAGFDLVSTIAKAEERLKQDQEEVARKLEEIKKQLAGLAHKVDVDPVFSNNTSKDDSGSDGGASGGSATETVADPTTLTMPVDDITVHDYLNNKKVSVILQPSANANENNFAVANGLTVPGGKSLTIQNGISTSVESGKTLQVDGHMETAGNLVNAGTVNSTSMNTLQICGDFTNNGTVNNTTGRVIIKGTLSNNGTVNNSSVVVITGGTGSESGAANAITLTGGTLNWQNGTATAVVVDGGTLNATGGTLESVDVQSGSFTLDGGTLSNGLVVGEGSPDIQLNAGTLNAGNKIALEINGELKCNPFIDSVKILANDPTKLMAFGDNGEIRFTDESGKEFVFAKGVLYSSDLQSPYSLQKIYRDGSLALKVATSETIVLTGNVKAQDDIDVSTEGEIIVELNGFDFEMPEARFGDLQTNRNYSLTIQNAKNTGKLILSGPISIQGDGYELNLQHVTCRRTENSRILNGGILRFSEVNIEEVSNMPNIETFLIEAGRVQGKPELYMDQVKYNSISVPFLNCNNFDKIELKNCQLMTSSSDSAIIFKDDSGEVHFDNDNWKLENNTVISNSENEFLLQLDNKSNTIFYLLINDNKKNTFKFKSLEGAPSLNGKYLRIYDEGYYHYIATAQTTSINLALSGSPVIIDEDMPLATDSDADSIDNEIIDEDEDYEKSTPSNADDFIHDEDEPYQDSDDDEDDEEPRYIPVEPVLSVIPSTSTKDTTQPEEDPDPKKDENPDVNNPEQEENQNGEPDSGPEEEQESEKETADLLRTEPSNVPDQREEEES